MTLLQLCFVTNESGHHDVQLDISHYVESYLLRSYQRSLDVETLDNLIVRGLFNVAFSRPTVSLAILPALISLVAVNKTNTHHFQEVSLYQRQAFPHYIQGIKYNALSIPLTQRT